MAFPWHDLFLKMFDWPFLLAFISLTFIYIFKLEIKDILKKGKITIKWGDSSIEIADLPQKIDQDIDPIKERLEIIEAKLAASSQPKSTRSTRSEISASPKEEQPALNQTDPKRAIYTQLTSKRYRYRSVLGLSQATGIPQDQINRIIQSDPRIGVITNREGNVLYFSKDAKPHRRIRARTFKFRDIN